MKYLFCLVFAVIVVSQADAGTQVIHAIPVTDTIRVDSSPPMDVDDILQAVALKAGIIKQGDQMRIT